MFSKAGYVTRWTIGGFLFGATFPLVGFLVASGNFTRSPAAAHASQPVLWIVDLAPFVLAATAALIGTQHARIASARRRTEELVRDRTVELENANGRLRDLMRSKDDFVGTVSHELRTPVTSVVGFSRRLLDNWDTGDEALKRELAALIASQSREMADMIDDLLVASRADLHSLVINREQIGLGDVVDECLRSFLQNPLLRVEVTSDVRAATVWADKVRVRQILRNLLTNAERYGGDHVWVESATAGDWAVIRVRDDGAGVPTGDVETIFQPYRQADSKVAGSMGLGLAVSRMLAGLMGGDLVYRREGDVTVFELRLMPAERSNSGERLSLAGRPD